MPLVFVIKYEFSMRKNTMNNYVCGLTIKLFGQIVLETHSRIHCFVVQTFSVKEH